MVAAPKIAGDWKPLFIPKRYGHYVNDHTFIKDHDGNWHLFGITNLGEGPDSERYFVHAVGGPSIFDGELHEAGIVVDTGLRAWAPCVVEHENIYYMYYGPSPTRLEVSFELTHWMGQEIHMAGAPPLSTHRDHMVIRLDDGRWLMFASGVKDGHSCISCHTSRDLLTWTFSNYALTSSGDAPLNPPWGAFESPYVLRRGDLYYLFLTYTDGRVENYQNMLVFVSQDPFHFGDYTGGDRGAPVVAALKSHAGEVIEENGAYYLTSAGWRGKGIPCEGGVAIARLVFE